MITMTKTILLCLPGRYKISTLKPIIMILGFFCLILSPATWGSEIEETKKGEQESTYQIGKVVVTAHEGGIKGITIEQGITSIDLDTYRSPKGHETIQDILESIPGIDIQRSTPALSDDNDVVKIRGYGGRRIMVRIDGRPIRNTGGFGDTLVDWTSLSLENIKRIEVMRGAHSAVYGETIGGTINIVTKKEGTRKDMKPEVSVMGDYSSYDTQLYTARAMGNVKDLGYSLAGGYRSSDGYLRNSDYEIFDFTGRLSYLFPFDGRLTFGYKISNQDKSLFVVNDPSRSDYDPSYPDVPVDAFSTPYYSGGKNFFDRETQYFDLIFEQPSRFGNWKMQIYKTKEDRDQIMNQFFMGDYRDHRWDFVFDDYGWILQDRLTLFDNHHVTFGFDGKNMYGKYHMERPPIPTPSHSDRGKRIQHRAGYIEDSWQITEALNLTLGLRYDHVDLNFISLYPAYGDSTNNTIDEWSPKSGLTYEFRPDTTGFINISKAFRVPTWQEWNSMGYPTGNNIESETAMEYEVGVLKKLGNNSMQLIYYYNDIDNYILFNRDSTRTLAMAGRLEDAVFNADYLKLQGIEAELNFEIFECLSGYINYTYQDYKLGPTPVPKEEISNNTYQLPKHKANIGLDWSPWEDTTIMTTLRYVDDKKTNTNDKIDDFITMDIGIEQWFLRKKLRLKGYISNLFDKEYEGKYLIPAEDRTFGINLSYAF